MLSVSSEPSLALHFKGYAVKSSGVPYLVFPVEACYALISRLFLLLNCFDIIF